MARYAVATYCRSLISGILPFGAVFVELFFILSAIWENQFYYLFGFLFLVFIILIVACSEVAIVMTYFQLCGEVCVCVCVCVREREGEREEGREGEYVYM